MRNVSIGGFLIGAIITVGLPAYSESLNPTLREEKSTAPVKTKAEADSKPTDTKDTPPLITTLPAITQDNQPQRDSKQGENESSEFWPLFYGFRLKVTDSLLVIFNALLFIVTGLLWRSTEKLWKAGERQLDHLKESLVVSSRAFVFVDDFDQTWTVKLPGPEIQNLIVSPRWKNSGDTPTRDLTINVNLQPIEGELPHDFELFYLSPAMQALIGPKANEWNEAIYVSDADAAKALSGELHLYIWGRADYRDVFSETPNRFTQFCYRLRFYSAGNEIKIQFSPYGTYNRSDDDMPPIKHGRAFAR